MLGVQSGVLWVATSPGFLTRVGGMLMALGGDGGMGMKSSSVIIEEGGTSNGDGSLEGKAWKEGEDFYSQCM